MNSEREKAPLSRRDALQRVGAGLAGAPVLLAVTPAAAQSPTTAVPASGSSARPAHALQNPLDAYPKPPFPRSSRSGPGWPAR